MKAQWKHVINIQEYVLETLAKEADDIPQEIIDEAPWVRAVFPISKIVVDEEMIANHDAEPQHIKRKNRFIEMIKKKEEILPLIILGRTYFLVDGYARYRALKELGVTEIEVLKQNFELKNGC